MRNLNKPKNRGGPASTSESEAGQSLVETVMALFVLTTGLTSGLALAIFSFGSSSDITQRITATGLAREGVEVIRSKRDSNWLAGTLSSCTTELGANQSCFRTWLNGIEGSTGAGTAYKAIFNPTSLTSKWTIGTGLDYRLYVQAGGSLSHTSSATPSPFFRKFFVIYQTAGAPETQSQVLVRSAVWWYGKRCNNDLTDYTDPAQTTCKIITEEYLTNWRNY